MLIYLIGKTMYRFKTRWPQVRKKLPELLYVAIVQTWFMMRFPTIVTLASPFDIIFKIGISILAFCMCFSIFVFPEDYASALTLEHLDNHPYPEFTKRITFAMQLVFAHVGFFLLWYKDYYGVSNTAYALLYAHCVILYFLIYKAVWESKNDTLVS